jgi:hypothetical protein
MWPFKNSPTPENEKRFLWITHEWIDIEPHLALAALLKFRFQFAGDRGPAVVAISEAIPRAVNALADCPKRLALLLDADRKKHVEQLSTPKSLLGRLRDLF